jgi:hypothetical protein
MSSNSLLLSEIAEERAISLLLQPPLPLILLELAQPHRLLQIPLPTILLHLLLHVRRRYALGPRRRLLLTGSALGRHARRLVGAVPILALEVQLVLIVKQAADGPRLLPNCENGEQCEDGRKSAAEAEPNTEGGLTVCSLVSAQVVDVLELLERLDEVDVLPALGFSAVLIGNSETTHRK